MSWLFTPAPGVDYWPRGYWGGERFVMLSTPVTRSKLSKLAFETASLTRRPSGMTPIPSTGNPGVDAWISSLRVSLASHFHSLETGLPTMTRAMDGLPPSGSFARYDPDTSSWRTFQALLLTGITEPYSENFPRQGMMRAGVCYQRPAWERRTSGTGSGLLPTPKVSIGGYQVSHGKQVPTLEGIVKFPTPTANDQRQRFNTSLSAGAARRPNLAAMARFDLWPTPSVGDATGGRTTSKGKDHPTSLNMAVKYATPQARDYRTGSAKRWQEARKGIRSCNLNDQLDGALNPDWVEWLMGWPVGWTSLEPLPLESYEDWQSKTLAGTWWAIEPDIPRVAVGVKDRTNRIAALGNGQVPAVVVKAWKKGYIKKMRGK